jgi:hypothetical protein
LIVSAIGTGVSAYGQHQSANAAEATAKYNANLAEDEARRVGKVAAENARRKQRENARILGAQRAAIAQSGFAMEGSPLAVLGESAMTLQRDILDMGYDAANRSRALQAQAGMSLWEGASQASAMRVSAAGSTASGLGNAGLGYLSATGRSPAG